MLLCLVKHSQPEIHHVMRELSKANDGENPAAHKELLNVIKYIMDMKELILTFEPAGNSNVPWEIICFSDSGYAGDPVSRRNFNVFILCVLVIPVSWL